MQKKIFTEDELDLLCNIFHSYKDCNRCSPDFIIPVMNLEKKIKEQIDDRYESDTTYDFDYDGRYSVFFKDGDEANDYYMTKEDAMELAHELEDDEYEVLVAYLNDNCEWETIYETPEE